MINSSRACFCKWTPGEEALIHAVLNELNEKTQTTMRAQLSQANKIQRILGWSEIDLYMMKNGKVCRDGLPKLFDDREFVLSKVITKLGADKINTSVSCVNGFLFSFESNRPIRPIAFRNDFKIEVLEIDRRFA